MTKTPGFTGLKKTIAAADASGGRRRTMREVPTVDANKSPEEQLRVRQRGGRRASVGGTGIAAARTDKKAVVGYYHPDVNFWLREQALHKGTTLQREVFECINLGRTAQGLAPFPESFEAPEEDRASPL